MSQEFLAKRELKYKINSYFESVDKLNVSASTEGIARTALYDLQLILDDKITVLPIENIQRLSRKIKQIYSLIHDSTETKNKEKQDSAEMELSGIAKSIGLIAVISLTHNSIQRLLQELKRGEGKEWEDEVQKYYYIFQTIVLTLTLLFIQFIVNRIYQNIMTNNFNSDKDRTVFGEIKNFYEELQGVNGATLDKMVDYIYTNFKNLKKEHQLTTHQQKSFERMFSLIIDNYVENNSSGLVRSTDNLVIEKYEREKEIEQRSSVPIVDIPVLTLEKEEKRGGTEPEYELLERRKQIAKPKRPVFGRAQKFEQLVADIEQVDLLLFHSDLSFANQRRTVLKSAETALDKESELSDEPLSISGSIVEDSLRDSIAKEKEITEQVQETVDRVNKESEEGEIREILYRTQAGTELVLEVVDTGIPSLLIQLPTEGEVILDPSLNSDKETRMYSEEYQRKLREASKLVDEVGTIRKRKYRTQQVRGPNIRGRFLSQASKSQRDIIESGDIGKKNLRGQFHRISVKEDLPYGGLQSKTAGGVRSEVQHLPKRTEITFGEKESKEIEELLLNDLAILFPETQEYSNEEEWRQRKKLEKRNLSGPIHSDLLPTSDYSSKVIDNNDSLFAAIALQVYGNIRKENIDRVRKDIVEFLLENKTQQIGMKTTPMTFEGLVYLYHPTLTYSQVLYGIENGDLSGKGETILAAAEVYNKFTVCGMIETAPLVEPKIQVVEPSIFIDANNDDNYILLWYVDGKYNLAHKVNQRPNIKSSLEQLDENKPTVQIVFAPERGDSVTEPLELKTTTIGVSSRGQRRTAIKPQSKKRMVEVVEQSIFADVLPGKTIVFCSGNYSAQLSFLRNTNTVFVSNKKEDAPDFYFSDINKLSFDMCEIFDNLVLIHCDDPTIKFLRNVANLLKKGGKIYLKSTSNLAGKIENEGFKKIESNLILVDNIASFIKI
jgi:hypothetical protein